MGHTNYIFDLDGTLIDSFEDIFRSMISASSSAGVHPPERPALEEMMHLKLDEIVKGLYPDEPEKHYEIIAAFKKNYDGSGFPGTILYPETKKTLEDLKDRGKRIFLVTNKRRSATEALLLKFDLSDMFKAVVTSDHEVNRLMSKKEMLDLLVEKNRLERIVSVYVGDTSGDYRAAMDSGMGFIFAAYGYGSIEDIPKEDVNLQVIWKISDLIL